MEKLFKRLILGTIACLALVFFVFNASSFTQEKKAESKKGYEEIVGKYEFDIEGQIMVIGFWIEDGKLMGGPEGEEPTELEPVEGEELKFTATTSEGQYFEIAFVRDDKGKVTKCVISTMGMDYEGTRIKEEK
ncbi:MAG: hypothetical protein JSV96_14315 [Candidatus Aminicenantes bacterium]|nr:MAG: hypothetical protein JSV96_14315 [Candidatus Aminicenantes bacterium]